MNIFLDISIHVLTQKVCLLQMELKYLSLPLLPLAASVCIRGHQKMKVLSQILFTN